MRDLQRLLVMCVTNRRCPGLRLVKVFITREPNVVWRRNLCQLTSLAESQKALEAHGRNPWMTNLLIALHSLGILTANITHYITTQNLCQKGIVHVFLCCTGGHTNTHTHAQTNLQSSCLQFMLLWSLMNIISKWNPEPFVTPASIKGKQWVTMMQVNCSTLVISWRWNLSQVWLGGCPEGIQMYILEMLHIQNN